MGVIENADNLGLFLGAHAEAVHGVGFLFLVQEAERNGLGVDRGNRGHADVEDDAGGLEVDAAILRQALFGDIHARHDLEARDDGVLEAEEIFWERHRHEQAVDAVADTERALLRLKVNVRRLVGDGLRDDVGHEAHDGGFFVDGFFFLFLGFGSDVAFVAIVERAGTDAEVFNDELVHALGDREVPDERARSERAEPVGHERIGQPGGGEVEGLRAES